MVRKSYQDLGKVYSCSESLNSSRIVIQESIKACKIPDWKLGNHEGLERKAWEETISEIQEILIIGKGGVTDILKAILVK